MVNSKLKFSPVVVVLFIDVSDSCCCITRVAFSD